MPERRPYAYQRTSLAGLTARAGRAAEDPCEMTVPATMHRMAKYVAAVLKENPDLTADQAARAAALKLRADMGQLARKSVASRKAARDAAAGTQTA